MPGVIGNTNGLKLKDPDVRQEAYMQYCKWLAKGKASRSFTFQKGDLKCTGKTIESYIKDNPVEFPPIHKEFSYSEGYAYWEQVVEDSAKGLNKDANTASLQMLMRNKYDWDKKEPEEDKYQQTEPVKVTLDDMGKLDARTPLQQKTDPKLSSSEEED